MGMMQLFSFDQDYMGECPYCGQRAELIKELAANKMMYKCSQDGHFVALIETDEEAEND